MAIAQEIVCVDCGGAAFLVQQLEPDEVPQVGDIVTYRCRDCLDRWDIELTEEDVAGEQ
ncbi:MAG: hypothetical protein ACOYN3_05515 [Acidimicrobiia bacterium]